MAWRSAFEYALRGGVSAVRGAVEGQLAAMQAQSESDYRNRVLAYQQKMADLELYKAQSDAAFREKELGELGRRADEQEKTKRYEIFTTDDGKRWIADKEGDVVREVAETKAKADIDVANIQAQADRDVAKTTTQGRLDVAELGAETDIAIEESRAATEAAADAVRLDIAEKGFASEEKMLQWELANKAYLAELEKSGQGGPDVAGLKLNEDQIKRIDTLATDYTGDKGYESLRKLQEAYDRGLAAYQNASKEAATERAGEQFETGVADIAMLNAFQHMIDPGVSVREGDVALLQSANSVRDQIALRIRQVNRGEKLTEKARGEMMQQMRAFYVEAMERSAEELTNRYQQRIDIDGLLSGTGVTVSNLGIDFAKVYRLYQQERAGGTAGGGDDPNTPVPGLKAEDDAAAAPPPTTTEPVSPLGAPGSDARQQRVTAIVEYARTNNFTRAELESATRQRMSEMGASDDTAFLAEVMAEFDGTPTTQNRQDFRNRGVKTDKEGADAEQ